MLFSIFAFYLIFIFLVEKAISFYGVNMHCSVWDVLSYVDRFSFFFIVLNIVPYTITEQAYPRLGRRDKEIQYQNEISSAD